MLRYPCDLLESISNNRLRYGNLLSCQLPTLFTASSDAAWELEPGAYADMVPPLPDQSMYMEGDVSFESVATVEVVRLPSAGTSTATNLPSRQSPYMTRSRNRTRSEMPRAPTAAAAAAALTERDSDNQHRQQQQPPRRRYETKAILPMYIRGGHMLLPTVQPNPTRRRYTQQPARRQRSTSLPVAAAARQNLTSSSTQPRDEPPVHQNANEGTEAGDDSILCPVITPVPSSLAS